MVDENFFHDPTGVKFLEKIAQYETECASATASELPKLGAKCNVCYEALGMTLAFLDCAASCYWGCAEGDHCLEFLIGRATNSAYAALSLARKGYYDQALTCARTLGENANLLALFAMEREKLNRWKKIDETARKREFSAVKVRLAIESEKVPVPINQDRYSQLSTFSIHAVPNWLPQAHNHHGQAMTFPAFQQAGLLLALNEISIPVGFIAFFGSHLLDLKDETRTILRDVGRALLESIGGVVVTEKGRPWFKLN